MAPNQIDLKMYERLSAIIAPGAKLSRAWPLHGGLSAQTMAFEILRPNQQAETFVVRRPPPWMLKKNPEAAATEFNLLLALHKLGIKVQRPVHLDAAGELFGTPSLTLEFIDAGTDFSPVDLKHTVQQIAAQLAEIHRLELHSFSKFISPKDLSLPPEKEGTIYTAAETKARDFLGEKWPLPAKNKLVLNHGDFWPGNLLWKDGRMAAVLDWELAGIADPLYDLAIARLDILWLFGPEAMEQFTREYTSLAKFDFTDLPYWDLRSALRTAGQFATWASVYPGLGRPDVTEASMQQRHQYFVEEAMKKISRAG